MAHLTLGVDHDLNDGGASIRFLMDLKQSIEDGKILKLSLKNSNVQSKMEIQVLPKLSTEIPV